MRKLWASVLVPFVLAFAALGVAQRAFDETLARVQQREAFGPSEVQLDIIAKRL